MADIPLELQPELPATPTSLLQLSEVFDRYGYFKLARHLRAAADSMSAHGTKEVHATLVAVRYEQHVEGSSYGVTFRGSDAAVHDVLLGQRYALVPVPADITDRRQLELDAVTHAARAVIIPDVYDDDRR